jgi:NADPH-dependent 2,4-dienoyl-CoA reductase/sulfur reductase-like enzyme
MNAYDVVVVGGGPAGIQTALSARNTYQDKSIALVRKEKIALIPCGIPYILHSLSSVDDDIVPDSMLDNNNVELLCGEVTGRNGKALTFADGRQVEFQRLVLATGSVPIKPPIPGIDLQGVYLLPKDYQYLQNLRDAATRANRVLIVGGGYVGVELADELLKAGKEVTVVEMLPSLLPTSVDPELSEAIREQLTKQGGEVLTGIGVQKFSGKEAVAGADLSDGRHLESDFVIVSVGYRPNVSLAEELGLGVDNKYGVHVDEYLRTSDPEVFAAGDCAAKRSCYTGEYRQIMLASTAMAQGRLAGSNLFGINVVKTFSGTLGTFSTKVGDVALGVTGLTETRAKGMGLEYIVGYAEGVDRHPGKLPGTSKMKTKLIFARHSHHLLGAQVLGGDSVGECINMLSVMIQQKMTDMEIDTLQIGTHPLLTPSPLAYSVFNATVDAIMKWYR